MKHLERRYKLEFRITMKAQGALFVFALIFLAGVLGGAPRAHAATMSLSPNTGTFEVGSTFIVSVVLNGEGATVNAFDVELRFPPDILQIVSPSSTGKSIVGTWVERPMYDNQAGVMRFQGGIPGGITTDRGIVATFTFRARKIGDAIVRFTDTSEVFMHDGKATPILADVTNGIYRIVLPPPQGPIVVSETFPDQTTYYAERTALFTWASNILAEGYSFMLSLRPVDIPDNISEGRQQSASYTNLTSGVHYFHIKALREGAWGGATHFAIHVDIDPPARFPITVNPSRVTTAQSVILNFATTDAVSGISHYEYRVIPLGGDNIAQAEEQSIFIEAESPQILSLGHGVYDVIVRAYDTAGNITEETERIRIVTPFEFAVRNPWTWIFLTVFGVLLGFGAWRAYRLHKRVDAAHSEKRLPKDIQHDLEELKHYRKTYGKMSMMLFVAGMSVMVLFGWAVSAQADESVVAPPFVTGASRDISNEDIFYIRGKTDNATVPVIVYVQDIESGSTRSFEVTSDNRGDWLYRHDAFLPTGRYIVWAQTRLGESFSPPTPQVEMYVRQTAFQFGSSRLSYETLYIILMLGLFAINIGLLIFIGIHIRHARTKRRAWLNEVREAEESLKRGFAVVRNDIGKELEIIHRIKKSNALSEEERLREEQLLGDLDWAEKYISKEIWDIQEKGE
ncbi:MAG: cohesin domain-containing protein [bacterium]|nr:cohesin domain-containing protein [bacterium]